MKYKYSPKMVCSRQIEFEINDGIVSNVSFIGGCNGNLQGICKLVEGMSAEEVVGRLQGIDCRFKGTSCPDQLACALKEAMQGK